MEAIQKLQLAWLHTHYHRLTDLAKIDQFELPLSELFADLPAENV